MPEDKVEKPYMSFSRLASFETCQTMYNLQTIQKVPQRPNWFAALGSIIHEVLESYEKGIMELEQLLPTFKYRYKKEALEHEFQKWNRNWYDQTVDFFENFRGFRTEATSIERKFTSDLGPFILRGIIDREVYVPDGDRLLIDHKVSNPFKGQMLEKKVRQLYLYSKPYYEAYGEFPTHLIFHFPRARTSKVVKFEDADYLESIKWAKETFRQIQQETNFPPTVDQFFCRNICSVYHECPYAP